MSHIRVESHKWMVVSHVRNTTWFCAVLLPHKCSDAGDFESCHAHE